MRNLRVGHPREEPTQIASLISQDARSVLNAGRAKQFDAGAKMLAGGQRKNTTIQPGILADVPEDTAFHKE